MSYIGKVEIDGNRYAIGTTLYGECGSQVSAAETNKTVTLNDFNNFIPGITIYVKFVNGNTASNVRLTVGNTNDVMPVVGNCICGSGEILAFTFESAENEAGGQWRTHTCGGVITQSNLDAALANLGPMKFKGVYQVIPNNDATTYTNGDLIVNGDVIAVGNKEYVYVESDTTTHWHELGDETEYVKHSEQSTDSISLLSWTNVAVQNGILSISNPTTSSKTVVIPVQASP